MSTASQALTNCDYKRVQKLIFNLAGITIPDGKQVMVQSRLAKRMRELNFDTTDEYLDVLERGRDQNELQRFVNCLTTNKTDFFREDHHFKFLAKSVFPNWVHSAKPLRIWSSASSTGEEPYSIAISALESSLTAEQISILATDIDTDVLAHAIHGVYHEDRVSDIPKYTLHRHFTRIKNDGSTLWKVSDTVQKSIKFRQFNLNTSKWPIKSSFDVIFCRNVMIYFSLETQKSLIARFAESLSPGGYLIIGHSESLYGISDLFEPIGDTIYRLKPIANTRSDLSSQKLLSPLGEPAKSTWHSFENASSTDLSAHSESFKSIIVGELYASKQPIWITTLLGSCIAACLFDPILGIGGMNHFMLPSSGADNRACASFGVHAMEMLINKLMKLGADRRRLRAKIFGGGAVIQSDSSKWNVGERNIEFILNFLKNENIPIDAQHLGDDCARQVRFHTGTFKALVKPLGKVETNTIAKVEQSKPFLPSPKCDVTLF